MEQFINILRDKILVNGVVGQGICHMSPLLCGKWWENDIG